MNWEVELTYFKQSGKYYAKGSYMTQQGDMGAVFDEVRRLLNGGRLPGLVDSSVPYDYIVYVEAPQHPLGYPGLVLRR